jgi:AcrR family transcriptional regulator
LVEAALTAEQVLVAAEDVLRRYGPAKATVVDVARELGVSHGSVYRHFPSKSALRDAVAERWLERLSGPLEKVVAARTPAPQRIRRWVRQLSLAKRTMALEDPQLFATYHAIASGSRDVVRAHEATLADQLGRIIADGLARGELATSLTAEQAGRAVFHATAWFSHPAHAAEWGDPGVASALDRVCTVLLEGLRAGPGDT